MFGRFFYPRAALFLPDNVGSSARHRPHKVDIVVATPGRLLDHLEKTPGFTLQHLRYLVIDEADRLLNQSYQGWVEKVIKAAHRCGMFIVSACYTKYIR